MGNEFLDGLGETISRTAKELGERAENLYETQKIRSRISSEERMVGKIKTDLGNIVYKKYVSDETVDAEMAALCEEIDQRMRRIARYKDMMADLKGQKICPSCQKAVDRDVAFCPYCGAACPAWEPEKPAVEVVVDEEEAGTCDCGSEEFAEEESAKTEQSEKQDESVEESESVEEEVE